MTVVSIPDDTLPFNALDHYGQFNLVIYQHQHGPGSVMILRDFLA